MLHHRPQRAVIAVGGGDGEHGLGHRHRFAARERLARFQRQRAIGAARRRAHRIDRAQPVDQKRAHQPGALARRHVEALGRRVGFLQLRNGLAQARLASAGADIVGDGEYLRRVGRDELVAAQMTALGAGQLVGTLAAHHRLVVQPAHQPDHARRTAGLGRLAELLVDQRGDGGALDQLRHRADALRENALGYFLQLAQAPPPVGP